jgi:hypothetical protein
MVQVAEPAINKAEPKLTRIRRIHEELSATKTENNALLELSEILPFAAY